MKVILSYSGGLDSTALLLRCLRDGYSVHAVSFDYGQKHKRELQSATEIAKKLKVDHTVVDLTSVCHLLRSSLTGVGYVPSGFYMEDTMKSTVVPARNALFYTLLFGLAESVVKDGISEVSLALAVHNGDHAIYPDCRLDFFSKLHESLVAGSWFGERIYTYTPYVSISKSDIIKDATLSCLSLGVDFESIFAKTWTSYDPENVGSTGSDVERILAFHALGMIDPFVYPLGWFNVLAQALTMQHEYEGKT